MSMISVRSAFVIAIVGSFIAGSFVASPELRALAANTVGSADIINNSILSADIKDGEVKTVDLGGNAVTSAKIKDGEVKAADIAIDAVGAAEIAPNSVEGGNIVDRSIGPLDMGFNSVGSLQIFDGEVNSPEIATDAVRADEIAGVSKLIFEQCFGTRVITANGNGYFECPITGASIGDNVILTRNTGSACLYQASASVVASNIVGVSIWNNCDFDLPSATYKVSIIVFKT